MKLEDFGTFVIFTALYAAGTLGLPKFSLLAYQVKVGEIPTAFVAIFGFPAVLGLTLGQFIANLGVEASPIAMISPVASFVGLLIVYRLRKVSTLAGCIAYIILTSAWLTYLLPITSGVTTGDAAYSAFLGQGIAVMIGYVAYLAANKMRSTPASPHTEQSTQH
ncbi:MAG: QueT transporter family protein [Candidatus Bathyarchaeia archaeon]